MNTPVSFELAKLLKEKGFNKETERVYGQIFKDTYGLVPFSFTEMDEESGFKDADYFLAPTTAQVVMWLYEKYRIWIVIDTVGDEVDYPKFTYKIVDLKEPNSSINYELEQLNISYDDIISNSYNSPTEAYEAAIKYVLQNLIQ